MSKLQEFREKYIYYAVIVVLTLVAITFLPLIGLDQQGQINFNAPASTMGWVIWGISKGCICAVNCLIFHFFILQGKDNVKDDPRYIEGMTKLNKYHAREYRPVSPFTLERNAYLKKGSTVLLTSALSLFALPSLVLQFSLVSFLSVVFSMVMALAFGVMAMRETEKRWTDQLKEYVTYVEQNKEPVQMAVEPTEGLAHVPDISDSVRSDELRSVGTVSTGSDNRQ